MIGRSDRPRLRLIGNLAFRTIGIRRTECRANVFESNAEVIQHGRIQIDSHRRGGATADTDLSDTRHLSESLLQDRRGRVVHLPFGVNGRCQRENHDRRVGRVELAIRRVVRQIRRELSACGIDRRLYVARSGVDVAVEIKLHGDRSRTE